MDMKIRSAVAAVTICFAGCANVEYCAVSASGKADGGIYHFQKEKVFHTSQPRCNYMIRLPEPGWYCATQNGSRKQPSGNILIVRTHQLQSAEIVQSIPVNGRTPCHAAIAPDGKFIYTANYSSGTISEIPFCSEKGSAAAPSQIIVHRGSSILPRQKSPHPHFTGFHPRKQQLFVCDLGTDRVMIYDYTASGLRLPAAAELPLPPGSGPRHLIFLPCGNRIFVANELNSTVTAFACRNGKWLRGKTISTRRKGATAAKNFPGAVKSAGNGKFFLVTNRGDDDIAIFAVLPDGEFKLCGNVPSRGVFPSDILVDEKNKLLRVINLKSNTIVTFAIRYRTDDMELQFLNQQPLPRGIALCMTSGAKGK